jgi:pimeloyl-ACP methyl ester carboxylesterase
VSTPTEISVLCEDAAYRNTERVERGWRLIALLGSFAFTATGVLTSILGPRGTHYYFMRSIGELADERPVIFYDQLGCGRSDRPTDKSLWTAERFAEELTIVVQELDLTAFHVWGHSWGTALAVL